MWRKTLFVSKAFRTKRALKNVCLFVIADHVFSKVDNIVEHFSTLIAMFGRHFVCRTFIFDVEIMFSIHVTRVLVHRQEVELTGVAVKDGQLLDEDSSFRKSHACRRSEFQGNSDCILSLFEFILRHFLLVEKNNCFEKFLIHSIFVSFNFKVYSFSSFLEPFCKL
jgi:hypothetical protein